MSKLQNNFTTQEQSKRLLELGVPADSSDCYYTWKLDHTAKINVLDNETYSELLDHISQITIPCWSVGRLMEIFAICFDPDFIHFDTYADGINFLQQMMDKFETYAENMDFSKSEG